MRRPRRDGTYPSPYAAIVEVEGVLYLIVERQRRGFRAVELTADEATVARSAYDDLQADLEARLLRGRRPSRRRA